MGLTMRAPLAVMAVPAAISSPVFGFWSATDTSVRVLPGGAVFCLSTMLPTQSVDPDTMTCHPTGLAVPAGVRRTVSEEESFSSAKVVATGSSVSYRSRVERPTPTVQPTVHLVLSIPPYVWAALVICLLAVAYAVVLIADTYVKTG